MSTRASAASTTSLNRHYSSHHHNNTDSSSCSGNPAVVVDTTTNSCNTISADVLTFPCDGRVEMMSSDNTELFGRVREDNITGTTILDLLPRARYRLPSSSSSSSSLDDQHLLWPRMFFESGVLVVPEYTKTPVNNAARSRDADDSSPPPIVTSYVVINLSDKVARIERQQKNRKTSSDIFLGTVDNISHSSSQEDPSID